MADESNHAMSEFVDTVVVGAGQAGLATGYQLRQRGIDHVIADEHDRAGASWRNRWDSLRLFTPNKYSRLPGMDLPGDARSIPSKDEIADYLAGYAAEFDLPVRTGVTVERIGPSTDGFIVEGVDGDGNEVRLRTRNVVVATGAFHTPRIPDFAPELNSDIVQMHSSDYRRPDQVADGDVLVVGAGSSGAEIALELSDAHHVWLSGRDPGQEPTTPGSKPDRLVTPIVWFMAHRVIDVGNPLGRKVRGRFLDPPRGIPRGRIKRRTLRARVEWVGRTAGVRDGRPELDDGTVLEVASVIWCTGYEVDFGWIDLPVFGDDGYPRHTRGIVESWPGLYFMGLPFQRSLSSALIGGVGRDAEHIACAIDQRRTAHHTAGATR